MMTELESGGRGACTARVAAQLRKSFAVSRLESKDG